jgi:ABC-type transport system involved in cytochrome c biogenesis permease component
VAAWLYRAGARTAALPFVHVARRALDPRQNPFLAAELRIQARRRALPRHLLLHSLTLAALFALLLWLAKSGDASGPSVPGLAAYLVAGIAAVHAWMVLHASNSRAREAAQREETNRMWEMLLVTPLSSAEIVLFKSVYPALYASLIALLALPIYLLASAISGASLGLLTMLYVVYGLLMVRLVAPLPPARVGRRGRRPGHAADSFARLFIWVWLLSWFLGRALRPLSPLAPAMFVTWPVVAAQVLPTPYQFYRWSLPPLAAVLLLGAPVILLNLRWAARRLVTHAAERPEPEPPGLLRRAVVLGAALVALGYAWPKLIDGGSLGAWMRLGGTPAGSVAALGWLLLLLGWLLFGVGGLITLPMESLEAGAQRQPRFFSGWLSGAATGSGMLRGISELLTPPLLVGGLACLIAGRGPNAAALPWLGRVLVVAIGAATLTIVLARHVRAAIQADSAARYIAIWIGAAAILLAPMALLLWPDSGALYGAAISPLFGFLAVLPTRASLSPATIGPLPPWWLSPVLNVAAAAALSLQRTKTPRTEPAARTPTRRRVEGWWLQPVERFAARWEAPILIKELRAGARRSDWRQIFSKIGVIALLILLLSAYNPDIVPGIASGLPLGLVPRELTGSRLFAASVVALLVFGLGWPMAFSSPALGAGTFSQERRKGTLGFLMLTPMDEAQIVRGKLLGAVAPLLISLALSLPVAAAAALFSLSSGAVWTFLFGYLWLLVACLTGAAFGTLASLLLPADNDPQAPPTLAMLFLQCGKLYLVTRLQFTLFDTGRYGLAMTAWYVVPLVALEALLGYLAYSASVSLLARSRHRDLRFVTEK